MSQRIGHGQNTGASNVVAGSGGTTSKVLQQHQQLADKVMVANLNAALASIGRGSSKIDDMVRHILKIDSNGFSGAFNISPPPAGVAKAK